MSNNKQPPSNVLDDRKENKNFVDNVPYQRQELEEFLHLIGPTGDQAPKEGSLSLLNVGEILSGKITNISDDFVIVDVGLKSEGLIPTSEFTKEELAELRVGSAVEVFLDQAEGEDGQIVLSKEKARKHRAWEDLVNNCKEGSIRKGTITKKVKGGLMVDISGMEAFLPGSQIAYKRQSNLDDLLGQTLDFKILKINLERKNVVVSRREILEEERISRKAELLEEIVEGSIRKGVVKGIVDFGAFIDLNGIDGLLHITDMSYKRLKHPSEKVQVGQEIEVVILHIDREKKRVALGLKQKEPNPFDEIEKRFPPGTRVKGKITNLLSYGAFMEIAPGIEGLIHLSEMSWTSHREQPSEVVKVGDEVEAVVLSIQKEDCKISLGIKQLERNPWEDVEKKYPVGSSVMAEIRNLTNYGAFVELEPGVDGLIHISDMSWVKKVSHPSEVLKKGDKVEAVVLSVDKENAKITLGLKQLSTNPWETIEKTYTPGTIVKGVVTKTVAFGAFVQLENGIEALIHVNEMSDNAFAKIEDVVSKGDVVMAKVVKVDPEFKKIALSIKDYLNEKNQTDTPKPKKGKKKPTRDEDEEEVEEE
jgi:small subunit ribosomal protein S1